MSMERSQENVMEWLTNQPRATITASQPRLITRLKQLERDRPNEVQIVAVNTDGTIVAHVPSKWLKIAEPKKINLTDEEREQRKERMAKARAAKKKNTAK